MASKLVPSLQAFKLDRLTYMYIAGCLPLEETTRRLIYSILGYSCTAYSNLLSQDQHIANENSEISDLSQNMPFILGLLSELASLLVEIFILLIPAPRSQGPPSQSLKAYQSD